MNTDQNSSFLFKILVVGKQYAGKTCCIKRLVYNTFTNAYKNTLGVDFAATNFSFSREDIQEYLAGTPPNTHYTQPSSSDTTSMNINISSQRAPCYEGSSKITLTSDNPLLTLPSANIRVQLWDIAGQECYASITRAYYRGAVAAVVVGDLESTTFYEDVLSWKRDIDEKVKLMDTGAPIPCILLCNKIDTPASVAWYSAHGEELQRFVQDNNFAGMYTTSALTGANLTCAFQHLCVIVLSKILILQRTVAANPVVVPMTQSISRARKSKCC